MGDRTSDLRRFRGDLGILTKSDGRPHVRSAVSIYTRLISPKFFTKSVRRRRRPFVAAATPRRVSSSCDLEELGGTLLDLPKVSPALFPFVSP